MRLNIKLFINYLHLHKKLITIWKSTLLKKNILEFKTNHRCCLPKKHPKTMSHLWNTKPKSCCWVVTHIPKKSAKCIRIQSALSIYTFQISEFQRWQIFVRPLSKILNHKPTFWNECWTKFHTQGYCCWTEFAQFRIFETSKIIWDSSITIKWNG